MSKTAIIILLFTLGLSGLQAQKTQPNDEGLKAMDWLIGKWSLTAGEEDSDGSFFKESGFSQCEYVSKGRMIRCEQSLITEDAGGRYKDAWDSRVIITYISYNKTEKNFLIRHIFPSRTHEHDFSAKSDSIFEGKWVYKNHDIGGDLDVTLRFERLDKNNFRETEFLKSMTNDFQEDFRIIGRRIY